MARPLVAIYRHDLLRFSETFVWEQAEHLRHFRAFYVGLHRVEGLALPADRVAVVNSGTPAGRLAEVAFQATGFSRRLRHALVSVRPRLMHAHFEGGGIAALRLAKSLRIPLVVTCHGFDVTTRDEVRWPNPVLRAAYRRRRQRLLRDGNLFIAVSEHIKRCMLSAGYPPDRIVLHYIGVDCERLRADPAIPREPVVLFVGRLVEKKGCEHLIRAMQRVQLVQPQARLVIVGEGPLRGSLESLGKELQVRTEFAGVQPAASVGRWMNRARVLSVPTVRAASGDMDGCCMVFPEAQAMSLPVASFDSGGTPEAVLHGQTGLLSRERDCDALSDSILRLLTDQLLWERFSEAARRHAVQRFNLMTQTRRLEEIYDRLLARPCAPPIVPAAQ